MAVSHAVKDQYATGPAAAPFALYLPAPHTSQALTCCLGPVKAPHPWGHAFTQRSYKLTLALINALNFYGVFRCTYRLR